MHLKLTVCPFFRGARATFLIPQPQPGLWKTAVNYRDPHGIK